MGKVGGALLIVWSVLMARAIMDIIMRFTKVDLFLFNLFFSILFTIVIHKKATEIIQEIKNQDDDF